MRFFSKTGVNTFKGRIMKFFSGSIFFLQIGVNTHDYGRTQRPGRPCHRKTLGQIRRHWCRQYLPGYAIPAGNNPSGPVRGIG